VTATDTKQGLAIIGFPAQTEWLRWLEQHHEASAGLWLKFAKKDSGIDSVTYVEAVEGALCYGWIDGQAASFDEQHWLQKFTPRRQRSRWSRINRDRAMVLIEQGCMQPAGLVQIELAQADGRWDAAYESPKTATVPDDLAAALASNPAAEAAFAQLNSTNRYAILYRVQDAKKPETRTRRIAQFVAMLAEGKKLH
jgi:uncharacterized protein YdeI (YjbR/CyaY-like superfamily)